MYLMKTAGWAGLMKQMLSDAYFVPSVWLECTLKLVSVCLRVCDVCVIATVQLCLLQSA